MPTDLPNPSVPTADLTGAQAARPCPYLGRPGDPETFFMQPHDGHCCHAVDPAEPIDLPHQARHCYADPAACPRFIPLTADGRRAPSRAISTAGGGPVAGEHRGSEEPMPGSPRLPAAIAGAAVATRAPVVRTNGVTAANNGVTAAPEGAPDKSRIVDATPRQPAAEAARAGTGLRARLGRLSFEEWLVYAVTGALVAVIIYFAFLAGPTAPANPWPSTGDRVAQMAAALQATDTATAAPLPSITPRPTRAADLGPPATAVVPTPAQGGLIAALSPSERGVGVFDDRDRVPEFGDRNLRVGRFDEREYVGGVLFPLGKLPKGSRVSYVALELAGLSDSNLSGTGTWTVEMLDPAAVDEWSNLTFETLSAAPASQMRTAWQLPAAELAARKINVLAFSDEARDLFMQRLDQGKVAFRIRGPKAGTGDNLFTWDTGFGQGFGTRPVLRVAFVPPPPTPGPPPGQVATATPLPLIVWVSDPTPAPTATPLPGEVPGLLSGMILFLSDRFGGTSLMVYDPAQGRVGQVTQSWPYALAKQRQAAAGGTAVRVQATACGGVTHVVNGDEVLVDPKDPARECAQLVIDDPATGAPREITQPGKMHYDPAVSPDGQWIAYVSTTTGNDEIFKIRPDGSDNTRLTENVWEWDKHPAWSPDGARLIFWSNRDGHKQLYLMNADGGDLRNISANAYNDWDPVWVR